VSFIDVVKTLLVDVHLASLDITIKTKWGVSRWVGQSTAGWAWLREDGNRVANSSGRAGSHGVIEKSRGRWELHMDGGLRRICIGWSCGRMDDIVFADWRWHGVCHLRRVTNGTGAGRGHRTGSLAAIASVGKLMIVKTASQLGLFQVSGNMFVGHFLEASLKEINFLQLWVS